MKKNFLLFLFIGLGMAVHAQKMSGYALKMKQADSVRNTYRREFILNPLSFFVGGFEIGHGWVFNDNKENFRLIAGYYFLENPAMYDGDLDEAKNMEGFRLEGQYVATRPVSGGIRYYLGGYLTYKSIRMDVGRRNVSNGQIDFYTARGSAVGLGILLGARNYLIDNFFMDIYLGGGPTVSLNETYQDDVHLDVVNPYKRSINPRAGLSLGIAF